MADRVLITGGAGFIGRHLAKALLDKGDHVRVLDAFIGQVHADRSALDDLGPDVEVQEGDVRDGDAVARRSRASTRSCISRPRSASDRACMRSTATFRSTTSEPRCCSRS